MRTALRLRGAAAALVLLVAAEASAQGAPEHQLSVYFHSTAQAYLSPNRTLAGVGGGVGLRDTFREHFLFQVDAAYLFMLGNVLAVKAGAGIQRPGTWSPSLVLQLSGLFGNELGVLHPDGSMTAAGPALGLGLSLSPLRFVTERAQVSVLNLGVGVGSDFPGTALTFHVTVLEVGARF
jgi:hypothetical protein